MSSAEKNLIVAGVDYSMSSPAMTIHHGTTWSSKNCTFHLTTKKLSGTIDDQRFIWKQYPTHTSDTERFTKLSKIFSDEMADVTHCYIEGYAMGASGRLATIGENTGFLKSDVYNRYGLVFVYPSPTEIKKFATGKGSASKDLMYEAFMAENPDIDIHGILGLKREKLKDKKPVLNLDTVSDIIDSYYVCKFGFMKEK